MKRRTKDQIIKEITCIFDGRELSVNEIARKIKANWSTVNSALELLKELGIVKEVITTPKIRVFKLVKK